MSVINQMLVDLEARRAADRPAIQARQTAYIAAGAPHVVRRVPRTIVWVIASVTIATALYAAYRHGYGESWVLLDRAVSTAVARTRDDANVVPDSVPGAMQREDNQTVHTKYPVDVIEQTTEFENRIVTTVSSARQPTRARDHDTQLSIRRDEQKHEPIAKKQQRPAKAGTNAKPTIVAAASPAKSVTAPVAANESNEPAEPQTMVRVKESQARIKKTPRKPSPEERFAQLLADARYALSQGDSIRALTYAEQAMQLAPGNAAAAELLLTVQLRGGDRDAAMQTLREVLQRDPRNVAYAQALARLLAARDEHEAAIGYLRRALANGRGDAESLALLAGLERRTGDFDSAAAHYLDALAQDRNVAVWWLGLGMSLEQLRQLDEARAAFGEAQRIGGMDAEVAAFIEQRLAGLDAGSSR